MYVKIYASGESDRCQATSTWMVYERGRLVLISVLSSCY